MSSLTEAPIEEIRKSPHDIQREVFDFIIFLNHRRTEKVTRICCLSPKQPGVPIGTHQKRMRHGAICRRRCRRGAIPLYRLFPKDETVLCRTKNQVQSAFGKCPKQGRGHPRPSPGAARAPTRRIRTPHFPVIEKVRGATFLRPGRAHSFSKHALRRQRPYPTELQVQQHKLHCLLQ